MLTCAIRNDSVIFIYFWKGLLFQIVYINFIMIQKLNVFGATKFLPQGCEMEYCIGRKSSQIFFKHNFLYIEEKTNSFYFFHSRTYDL